MKFVRFLRSSSIVVDRPLRGFELVIGSFFRTLTFRSDRMVIERGPNSARDRLIARLITGKLVAALPKRDCNFIIETTRRSKNRVAASLRPFHRFRCGPDTLALTRSRVYRYSPRFEYRKQSGRSSRWIPRTSIDFSGEIGTRF